MKTRRLVKNVLLTMSFPLLGLTGEGCCGGGESLYQRPVDVSPEQAQKLLEEGNQRFVASQVLKKDLGKAKRDDLLNNGQKPFAVVLCCSDSRVPPEHIFDQGLGDLFVIRVAGNVLDQTVLSSVIYGVEHLNAPLLVVLGHSDCGAVKATVQGAEVPGISDRISPLVEKVKASGVTGAEVYPLVEDENVGAVMAELNENEEIKHLVEKGALKVVGAKYHLDTGLVTLFPGK